MDKCIDSILKQTLREMEIILINDGSTDNSNEICLDYAKQYPNKIKYINNQNIGCSATRNLGISLARGEYIAFVDSDDYIEKNMYEEMFKFAEIDKKDIVVCGINYVDVINNKVTTEIPKIWKEKYDFLSRENKIGNSCNKIFNREFVLKKKIIFPINTHFVEDLVFCFKIMLSTDKIGYVYKPFYNYILHGNNSIYNLEKKLGVFVSFNEIYKFIKEKNLLNNLELMNKFYELYKFYAIKCTFDLLWDYKKLKKKDYKKYKKLFFKKFREEKFLTFDLKLLIIKYKLKLLKKSIKIFLQ